MRKFTSAKKFISNGFKRPKNKGKIGDGEYNYIVLAYELRTNDIIIPLIDSCII